MRRDYNLLITTNAHDDEIDDYVDSELRRRPFGVLALVTRLNWLRREELFPDDIEEEIARREEFFKGDLDEETRLSPSEEILASIRDTILLLRQGAPDAAAKLRALAALRCRGNLALGLSVVANVGPSMVH